MIKLFFLFHHSLQTMKHLFITLKMLCETIHSELPKRQNLSGGIYYSRLRENIETLYGCRQQILQF